MLRWNLATRLDDVTEAIRINPKDLERAICSRDHPLRAGGEQAEAVADYTQAISLEPDQQVCLIDLARFLAVSPDAKVRDGGKAVEYATKACKVTAWKNRDALESLAAAYAEFGKFEEAVKWCRRRRSR